MFSPVYFDSFSHHIFMVCLYTNFGLLVLKISRLLLRSKKSKYLWPEIQLRKLCKLTQPFSHKIINCTGGPLYVGT